MFSSKFVKAVEANADYDVVEKALVDLTSPFGVIALSNVEVRAPLYDSPFVGRLLGKRDTEYVTRYRRENLAEHDVTIKRALRSLDAFSWRDSYEMANTPDRQKVFSIAAEHGYHDGWIVPHYGEAGGVGVTSYCGDQICDSPEARHTLTYAGIMFYRYAQKKAQQDEIKLASITLTERQEELVYWITHGKTDREIAILLGISHRTVHRHMEDLRKKFGVRARAEVIAKVLQHNLFDRPKH